MADTIPLPEPDFAQAELPRFFKDTLKHHKWWNEASLHAHAAAVSAAKDAEIAALREDADVDASIILACGHALLDRDKVIAALRAEVDRLLDALENADVAFESADIFLPEGCGQEFGFYASWEVVRAALAARKGTT